MCRAPGCCVHVAVRVAWRLVVTSVTRVRRREASESHQSGDTKPDPERVDLIFKSNFKPHLAPRRVPRRSGTCITLVSRHPRPIGSRLASYRTKSCCTRRHRVPRPRAGQGGHARHDRALAACSSSPPPTARSPPRIAATPAAQTTLQLCRCSKGSMQHLRPRAQRSCGRPLYGIDHDPSTRRLVSRVARARAQQQFRLAGPARKTVKEVACSNDFEGPRRAATDQKGAPWCR